MTALHHRQSRAERGRRFRERLAKLPTLALSADDQLAAEWAALAGDAPPREVARVLNQDEINSLLGFEEGEMGNDGEPSMGDILASIRRILTEDDPPPPKPSLWVRIRRRLFPTWVAVERMAAQLEAMTSDVGRLRERLSRIRVLTQQEIDDLLSFDEEPSPYAVRREIDRLRVLLADIDLQSLIDHLTTLKESGKADLLADSLMLAALEGGALLQEMLAAAFPDEIAAVVDRISRGVTVSTERATAVADGVRDVLDASFRYDEVKHVQTAGVLADSLRHPVARRQLIGSLLTDGNPRDAAAQAILEKLISFDSLTRISDEQMRLFLADEAVRPKLLDWATALKGKPDAIRDRILRCLTTEDAAEVSQSMEATGPVQQKAVEEAEAEILVAFKVFVAKGVIPWATVLGGTDDGEGR